MKLLLLVLTLGFTSLSFAKQFGDAGCGLGSLVFGTKPGVSQVFAATTNGTSGSQTFGITTGTSNCTDDGAVAANKEVIMFIEVNKTALANESAKGNGETVNGLAQLMNVDANTLGQTLKNNYKDIFVETKMQPSQIQAQIESHMMSL